MEEITRILDFIVEVEKLKNVHRKTKPTGLDRYENSAEHSWHVCLLALTLRDHADAPIDIDRVIRMLIIHDLGEIDVGDTIIYASEAPELKAEEAEGVKRLLAYLPEHQAEEYLALWYEFEEGETADSRYARAIDRIPPILQNINSDGHSWKTHNIPAESVYAVNSRIAKGSEAIWAVVKGKLDQAKADGLLK
ncbi:HD domain-containing protein [Cerasicoccus fimbriatus]|uniref:HD domain-containing protein n=1 Tax=Cerasicoccus fimbriatus TaxID=3014554 RepID=UPI0022B35476|nr:HD domain-containing protein [Cerasicoccus sp. TK19100]